jgi:hypothetical protein
MRARFQNFVADVPDGWRDTSVVSFAWPADVVADPRAMRPTSPRPRATVTMTAGDAPPATASQLLDEQLKHGAQLFSEYAVHQRGDEGELCWADVSFVQGERVRQLVCVRRFGKQAVIVTGSAFDATWAHAREPLLAIARSVTPHP